MENKIRQKLDQIGECILYKINQQQVVTPSSLGLYSGDSGILLFLFYYSKFSQDKDYLLYAESYCEYLLDNLGSEVGSHTYCSGLSGILYLFEFLREKDFIDIDIRESQEILDNYLIDMMRANLSDNNYDFLHGAIGVGFYFMKKGTHKSTIVEIINYFKNTAEIDKKEECIKWKSILDDKGISGYNISLSHGMSSIILFFVRAIKNNIEVEKCQQMLDGAVNYILSQEIDFNLYGSFFPCFSIETPYIDRLQSRLGWCYGDLGIAFSLWHAGKIHNNVYWRDKGLNILLQSTNRMPPSEDSVIDAGICHGSAGIAMIYRRMYLETGIDKFSESAIFWLNETLNHSKFKEGLAGYKSYKENCWEDDYSLLMGISGIGLTFLSELSNDEQSWDELFLLT